MQLCLTECCVLIATVRWQVRLQLKVTRRFGVLALKSGACGGLCVAVLVDVVHPHDAPSCVERRLSAVILPLGVDDILFTIAPRAAAVWQCMRQICVSTPFSL